MIAYRQATRTISVADVLAHADDPLTFLIEFGEMEAALADQLCPHRDALRSRLTRMREVMLEAARALITGQGNIRRAIGRLRFPETMEVSIPEGYAWYGLSPRAYIDAAERFWRERQPLRVVVIGIRGIGASLSAVVAAALEQYGCAVESFTVRPHGHPFYREVRLNEELGHALLRLGSAHYVIVDEGPGLSGSSFASVAEAVSALGVADGRIVFMPAWLPDGSAFVSRGAEARWRIHDKFAASSSMPDEAIIDLSAGQWREVCFADESLYPAVQPQHEVRKYLCRSNASLTIMRWAGLGRYGREKLERARMLAAAGFSPAPIALANGWLTLPFVPGRPMQASDFNDAMLDLMARYIAFRRRAFATGRAASTEELAELIRVNTGIEAPLPREPEATIVDGRMAPHEWIAGEGGDPIKVDSLDHGDNHFYPGPADICWDLAGAMIEWKLDQRRRGRLLRRYVKHSGDGRAAERLPFYLLAYTAFRIGYTHMAGMAPLSPAERERLEELHRHYRAAMEREGSRLLTVK